MIIFVREQYEHKQAAFARPKYTPPLQAMLAPVKIFPIHKRCHLAALLLSAFSVLEAWLWTKQLAFFV